MLKRTLKLLSGLVPFWGQQAVGRPGQWRPDDHRRSAVLHGHKGVKGVRCPKTCM